MRSRAERGSALMLVPAGILVLIALGGIAVDSAIAFMAQRELEHRAEAAVNDAVTIAIPAHELQRAGDARFDPAVATASVRRSLEGVAVGGLVVQPEDVAVSVDPTGGSITAMVEGDVPYVFAPAIPGARSSARVRASASVELRFSTE